MERAAAESCSGGYVAEHPLIQISAGAKALFGLSPQRSLVGPTLQQALSGAVRSFGSRRFSCRNSCKETKVPSIDKGRYGFDGQKCAHTASSPLTIQQVFMVRKRNRIHGGRKSLYNTEGWNQCPQREMYFSPISPVGKRAGQSRQYCRRSRAERFAPLRRIYRRSQQPTPARLRPPTSAWHTGRPA